MVKGDMVDTKEMNDFKTLKTIVEEFVTHHGHFYQNLNPIECVWGQAKKFTRANCNYTLMDLKIPFEPALNSVHVELIRKYH